MNTNEEPKVTRDLGTGCFRCWGIFSPFWIWTSGLWSAKRFNTGVQNVPSVPVCFVVIHNYCTWASSASRYSPYVSGAMRTTYGIATGLRAGRPEFNSRQGQEIFLYATASKPALGPTQPPIQWVPGALSEVKRPEREADRSPSSSAEVKNGGAIPPLPHTSSWSVA
jgi:hypothetical protein